MRRGGEIGLLAVLKLALRAVHRNALRAWAVALRPRLISPPRPGRLLICALLVALGCGKTHPGYEFMPDMARSVPYDAFDPNQVTRNGQTLQRPVAGTVARGALPFRFGTGPEEAERAGRELVNPFPPTPEVLARGEAVYRTFCWVCHGETGQGDGPIIPKFPNPPSYTSDRVRALPEGRIFHVISRGSGLMPSYAVQISPEDRWKAVRYVQRLQAGATREAKK